MSPDLRPLISTSPPSVRPSCCAWSSAAPGPRPHLVLTGQLRRRCSPAPRPPPRLHRRRRWRASAWLRRGAAVRAGRGPALRSWPPPGQEPAVNLSQRTRRAAHARPPRRWPPPMRVVAEEARPAGVRGPAGRAQRRPLRRLPSPPTPAPAAAESDTAGGTVEIAQAASRHRRRRHLHRGAKLAHRRGHAWIGLDGACTRWPSPPPRTTRLTRRPASSELALATADALLRRRPPARRRHPRARPSSSPAHPDSPPARAALASTFARLSRPPPALTRPAAPTASTSRRYPGKEQLADEGSSGACKPPRSRPRLHWHRA